MLEFWVLGIVHHSITPPLQYSNGSIFEPHFRTEVCAVFIRFQPRRADPVCGEFLIALLGIAGDADRPEQFAAIATNEHAAALRKYLIARCTNEVLHEERPFFRPHSDKRR